MIHVVLTPFEMGRVLSNRGVLLVVCKCGNLSDSKNHTQISVNNVCYLKDGGEE